MKLIKNIGILIMALLVLTSFKKEHKPLQLAPFFTDNMVLQANKPVTIWGTATPGEIVTIKVRTQSQVVKTDEDGKWSLKLASESYGSGDSFSVESGNESITYHNIAFGEVWLCSGQSNMELPLVSNWAHIINVQQEVENANYPEIRLFTVAKNIAFQPIDAITTEGWQVCDTNTVKNFSATAYFFGRKLYNELKVPIGLVHSSWGGTVAEAWTSKKTLLTMDDFADQVKLIASNSGSRDSLLKKYEIDMAQMQKEVLAADKGYKDGTAYYAQENLEDTDWFPIDLPKMWEETDLGNYDGSTWFRKKINFTKNDLTAQWTLHLGAPDDYDEAWVNGVKVGENRQWNVLRAYKIPQEILKKGDNTITLRVYDYTGGGGFMGEAHQYKLASSDGKEIPIAKNWVAKKGFDFKDIETRPVSLTDPNQPTVLFNAMLNPILPLTFQGAIWYQGESNAGRAFQYRELFKAMISDWRKNFDNDDFPFYFVQLANYLPRNTEPVEDTWAELREAQTMALDLPNTGMAVSIDIGDALDIHPGNKQDVGIRLALNALAKTYKKEVKFFGPMYKSHTVKESAFELSFDYATNLKTSDQKKLTGFSIAGEDKKFVWADAVIEGNKIVITSPKVINPVAVRYAWSSNPACNLTNETGLPASPFRTDTWKGITE